MFRQWRMMCSIFFRDARVGKETITEFRGFTRDEDYESVMKYYTRSLWTIRVLVDTSSTLMNGLVLTNYNEFFEFP